MRGHIEPLFAVLRLGGSYGEECEGQVFIQYEGPTRVKIMGLNATIKPSHWKAMIELFKLQGITSFWFFRVKDGDFVAHEHVING